MYTLFQSSARFALFGRFSAGSACRCSLCRGVRRAACGPFGARERVARERMLAIAFHPTREVLLSMRFFLSGCRHTFASGALLSLGRFVGCALSVAAGGVAVGEAGWGSAGGCRSCRALLYFTRVHNCDAQVGRWWGNLGSLDAPTPLFASHFVNREFKIQGETIVRLNRKNTK